MPIASSWGGVLLASLDGLRFVVPTRMINAARYTFGTDTFQNWPYR
jgi:hypothetical protein